jgi:tRNA 5-methylaminomethyl-2-thiouridine biosynthesis bifunctional protein
MQDSISSPQIEWRDGEPYNQAYGDIYYSRSNGLEESRHVFLHNSKIIERWHDVDHFVIAETGFGTGLNFLVTVQAWLAGREGRGKLTYFSTEKHPMSVDDLRVALAPWTELSALSSELLTAFPASIAGVHRLDLFDGAVSLILGFGDAQAVFEEQRFVADAWYLDGFAPSKNPQMWSPELFSQVARLSKVGTTVATFTVAGIVRRGLAAEGFDISKPKGFGGKRENLLATLNSSKAVVADKPWFSLPQQTQRKDGKVVVIGAGIAGVTTAYQLAQRGHQVTLLEREPVVASKASGNMAGLVLPRIAKQRDAISQFYLQAFLDTVNWLDQLKASDDDLPWHKSGVLMQLDAQGLHGLPAWYEDAALFELVDAQALPSTLRQQGLWAQCNQAGWLRPQGLCEHLLARSPQLELKLDADVVAVEYDGGQWQLSCSNGETHSAEVVVMANAHDAHRLPLTAWLDVAENVGQLAYIDSPIDGLSMPVSGQGYIIPADQIVLGATYSEPHENDLDANRQQLQAHWQQYMSTPLNDGVRWEDRVASRTVSRDRLPMVGPLPDVHTYRQHFAGLAEGKTARYFQRADYLPGFYVNLAHGSRGLVTANYVASGLADLISYGQTFMPAEQTEHLHPGRFCIRDLRKNRS